MVEKSVIDAVEHEAAQQAVEHGAEGSNFILEHLLAHRVVKLPIVVGVDLSIDNHVLMVFVTGLVLLLAFGIAFRKRPLVPHGFANLLEMLTEYIYKEALVPNLGHEAKAFSGYLMTAFYFILVANLLGLVPFGAAATGNIAVTITLAVCTLIVGQYAGIRKFGLVKFYKHLIPSGLPIFVIPILLPVEIMSLFAKHISLAIRLFANMMGGHITILAIMSLIFIFKSWIISPLPLALIIFSSLLEVLISFIQAYVFTTLSAVFIGTSLAEAH